MGTSSASLASNTRLPFNRLCDPPVAVTSVNRLVAVLAAVRMPAEGSTSRSCETANRRERGGTEPRARAKVSTDRQDGLGHCQSRDSHLTHDKPVARKSDWFWTKARAVGQQGGKPRDLSYA
jgi:hypothetical protein